MKILLLICIICFAAAAQQNNRIISGYSSVFVRHEIVSPGSFKVDGNTVTFLYKGITESVEIPEYDPKSLFHVDTNGKVTFEPEFWSGMYKTKAAHERDEEWQRKGYPIEFRAFMIRTLKQLSIEKANPNN